MDKEEQLLKLFWNRAELKKELKLLRDDSFRLNEQLKQHEAKALQTQQYLEQLETVLGDPEKAMTAVAHYRLKAIWNFCRSKLESLGSELARAQHDKNHRQHIDDFNRKIEDSLVGLYAELDTVTEEGESFSSTIRGLCEQRDARRGPWNYFRRRRLTAEINKNHEKRHAICKRLEGLAEVIKTRQNKEPPEFQGLNVTAKRKINLGVIAYAQELFLHFADRDLAAHMRDSSIQQMVDACYGDRRDCRALCKYADMRIEALAADTKVGARVQFRAQKLGEKAEFRHEDDTIPVASTLGIIPVFKSSGDQCGELEVNILGQDYWDVYSVLVT